MEFGADAPALYYNISERERESRCDLTEDLCVIDEEHFFIRDCLRFPRRGTRKDTAACCSPTVFYSPAITCHGIGIANTLPPHAITAGTRGKCKRLRWSDLLSIGWSECCRVMVSGSILLPRKWPSRCVGSWLGCKETQGMNHRRKARHGAC
ncbi:MAG: DUF2199 domain-containing protein [Planctomycetota bacterium]|nr:DUF2199 domain-containing protein [Planctomycetota bacterium]